MKVREVERERERETGLQDLSSFIEAKENESKKPILVV